MLVHFFFLKKLYQFWGFWEPDDLFLKYMNIQRLNSFTFHRVITTLAAEEK